MNWPWGSDVSEIKLCDEDNVTPEIKISQIQILALILTCWLLFCKSPIQSEFLRPSADGMGRGFGT